MGEVAAVVGSRRSGGGGGGGWGFLLDCITNTSGQKKNGRDSLERSAVIDREKPLKLRY